MRAMFNLMAALLIAGAMNACNEAAEQPAADAADGTATTRAYGTKTPIVAIYVETNDVNPLNAGDYLLTDGTTYADIVEFFASNIHSTTVDGVVQPTLYFNDKMTNLFENGGAAKYVKGLQDKGIKVLLTVLGDWQHIGVANMNDTQVEQFTTILAYAVERYGLDGIGFDDEYADYTGTLVDGSFGNVITSLRAKMPTDKLITVFQYGNISQINAAAGALIDYDYSNFAIYNTYITVPGVTKEHYAPMSINLGYTYDSAAVARYGNYAYELTEAGYGAIMHFNLRRLSEVDQLPLFSAIADGAWEKGPVTVATEPSDAGNRPQDWEFVPTGFTITYANATGADPLPPVAR